MSKKKRKIYKEHFDIRNMMEEAESERIPFIIAISEDSQRGAGKTFSVARYLTEKYMNEGKRCMLLIRDVKLLGKTAEGVFNAMLAKCYPGMHVYEKKSDNVFSVIYIQSGTSKDKKTDVLGYVAPLKNAGDLKNFRGIFEKANVKYFFMDEFMTINCKYLQNEISLFKTIYDTVNGECDYIPMVMTANCITLNNPWFQKLGLNKGLIQSNTRRIKTNSVIYENIVVEGLADKHINSPMNIALGQNTEQYLNNAWLADDSSLVCKTNGWGRPLYICGLVYEGITYGVYFYSDVGLYYVSTSFDSSCDCNYALTLNGERNIPILRNNRTVCHLRDWFYDGIVRCSNGKIQRMLLDIFA